jgi:hypothetical protein
VHVGEKRAHRRAVNDTFGCGFWLEDLWLGTILPRSLGFGLHEAWTSTRDDNVGNPQRARAYGLDEMGVSVLPRYGPAVLGRY